MADSTRSRPPQNGRCLRHRRNLPRKPSVATNPPSEKGGTGTGLAGWYPRAPLSRSETFLAGTDGQLEVHVRQPERRRGGRVGGLLKVVDHDGVGLLAEAGRLAVLRSAVLGQRG